MTGSEIISLILNDLGIKAPTFAKTIGVQYQRILDIQSGKTKRISAKLTDKIVEAYPRYNKVWLLTGDGEMIKNLGNFIQGDVNGDVVQGGGRQQNINISLPSEGEQKIIRPDGTVEIQTDNSNRTKLLEQRIEDLERIIKSKDEMIELLKQINHK